MSGKRTGGKKAGRVAADEKAVASEKSPRPQDERRRSPRYVAQLNARLLFSVVMMDAKVSDAGAPTAEALSLVGHTLDVSELGLGLVVPVREIDEAYLAGGEVNLRIELYLPDGAAAIEIEAKPVRFQKLGEEKSIFSEGYLIGAEITRVSDRDRFVEYLRTLSEADA